MQKTINYNGHLISLFYPQEGNFFDASSICNKKYNKIKKFNYLYIDFKDLFSDLIDLKINKGDFETKIYSKNHKITQKPAFLKEEFQIIKKVANSSDLITIQESKIYLKAFQKIYQQLDNEFNWKNSDFFLAPLKGGGVITELFNLPTNTVLKLESKRVPLIQQTNFGFGFNSAQQTPKEIEKFLKQTNNKEITILEICVATGMTTVAFLLDLYAKNIKPKKIKILASVISVQGIKFIEEFAKKLNYNIEFITAKIVFKLDNYYTIGQDSLLYNDGQFVVKSPWDAYGKITNQFLENFKL